MAQTGSKQVMVFCHISTYCCELANIISRDTCVHKIYTDHALWPKNTLLAVKFIFECGKGYIVYRKDLNQEHTALFEVGRYFCTL